MLFSCKPEDNEKLLMEEWLITNGIGGYACGTVGGALTRKYHGLLVASLKAPFGRSVMLNYVADTMILPDNKEFNLSVLQFQGENTHVPHYLVEFRLEDSIPVWVYKIGEISFEKRVWMAYGQNTVYIQYHLISSNEPVFIKWRPYLQFRISEHAISANEESEYHIHSFDGKHEISSSLNAFPNLNIWNEQHPVFVNNPHVLGNVFYEIEKKRGYDYLGSLKSPGFFLVQLEPHQKTTFFASTEAWTITEAMSAEESLIAEKQREKSLLKFAKPLSYSKAAAKMVLAADQFIIKPVGRDADIIRLRAMGENCRSVIAGYPWFTDWGRDTMISLEGLTLVTGRPNIALAILRTFAYYIRDGLIPNMFPDGHNQGLYHTADATLWFFHAVDRYLHYTHDDDFLEFILPRFQKIIDAHVRGTSYGIKMDEDGLLIQGQEGYQLTWMDAKVNDWVVTPRRGKAVEINALWYNALKLMEQWTGKPIDYAKTCYESFNKKFWIEEKGHLYDVVETNDPALRPNQIFSISLRYPVLEKEYWKPVLDNVEKDLLTRYGLRTLTPFHPEYKSYYEGDLVARDAAYHQGTVWPWLLGPFVDAWLKVYPEKEEEAKKFIQPLETHIYEHCLGTLGEIFDSADPYNPRGCFAQAWSVAEFLRIYAKLHHD